MIQTPEEDGDVGRLHVCGRDKREKRAKSSSSSGNQELKHKMGKLRRLNKNVT